MIVRVLPVPAPALMSKGPATCRTGATWLGERSLQSNGAEPNAANLRFPFCIPFDAGEYSFRRPFNHLLQNSFRFKTQRVPIPSALLHERALVDCSADKAEASACGA